MKSFAIILPLLVTGTTTTVGVINNTSTHSSSQINSPIKEISTKNISEIANISTLKTQQTIEELKPEVLETISVPKTTSLQTTYVDKMNVNDFVDKLTIKSESERFNAKQTELGNLLKETIKLDKQKTAYENVKSHFDSNPIEKSKWEIKYDTNSVCAIQKQTPPVTPPKSPPDCYDWNVILIDVDTKIKALLQDNTSLLTNIP